MGSQVVFKKDLSERFAGSVQEGLEQRAMPLGNSMQEM